MIPKFLSRWISKTDVPDTKPNAQTNTNIDTNDPNYLPYIPFKQIGGNDTMNFVRKPAQAVQKPRTMRDIPIANPKNKLIDTPRSYYVNVKESFKQWLSNQLKTS